MQSKNTYFRMLTVYIIIICHYIVLVNRSTYNRRWVIPNEKCLTQHSNYNRLILLKFQFLLHSHYIRTLYRLTKTWARFFYFFYHEINNASKFCRQLLVWKQRMENGFKYKYFPLKLVWMTSYFYIFRQQFSNVNIGKNLYIFMHMQYIYFFSEL